MTRDEILNMPAGPEMDALVAIKVMGFRLRKAGTLAEYGRGERMPDGQIRLDYDTWSPHGPNRYSTDITAAWQVVEYFRNLEYDFELYRSSGIDGYTCRIGRGRNNDRITYFGDTAPLAICRAALIVTMAAR